MPEGLELELVTVRDWLRYAVSRFGAAGLVYGHGTSNALDEAAYLILHTLHLPIDQLDPWLDARLLPEERQALHQTIETRIATRKPARLCHARGVDPGALLLCRRAGHRAALVYRRIVVQADGRVRRRGAAGPRSSSRRRCPGPLHGVGLPGHSGRPGVPECDGRCQRHLAGRACRRRAQCARLWSGGAHFAAALRSVCRPRRPALRPHRCQSALRRRRGAGGLPARICGRAEDRPRWRRRWARDRSPHPG